jgi:hypothetical protein
MPDGSSADGAPSAPSFLLSFNVDQLTFGAGATGLASPLQQLIGQAPAGTQQAKAWLPDLSLSSAQALISLSSGNFGAYVTVSDSDGNSLASFFFYLEPGGGQDAAAAGITLDAPVDLAATPLFGGLLSGVQITDFSVSYASQAFAAGIMLPSGPGGAAQPYQTALPSGFGLTVTATAGGSAQTFTLPSGSSDSTASTSPEAQRVLSAPGLDRGPPDRPLASQAGGAPPVSWFAVQKSLGPLFIDRVGVVADSGTLGLGLDASLDTDVLSIQLTGFVITFTPGSMASAPPAVSLDGLAAAVDCGALQIAGSLVRTQGQYGTEYDGSLLISIGPYAINAAGSYAVVDGAPSLFVFGIAQGEFGGPPAFFVTGLAAGFGLNRALLLPAGSQVATFPLIEAAEQGAGFAPPGVQGAQDALAQLNSGGWVPPTLGEYWVAAGVAFQSFGFINGFVLVTVEFGQELVIALLGFATMQLPIELDGGPGFGYIEIALEAVLRPADGTLSIEALLTPNSYVIDPACQLTGGIAFDLWFGSNPHAGDFVFTAGGYNPAFPVPSWYPTVPRLGFLWHLGDSLQITGQAYFAITPSCVMGGGLLALTFAAGGLQAWFTAQADFIMYWRPFSFDIDVNISIGISYTGSIGFISVSFTVELGVSVELWGLPLQGIAHVNWWVISFSVSINQSASGGGPTSTPTVLKDWDAFAALSLPAGTSGGASVCRARPAAGLQTIVTTSTGETIWQFGGDSLALSTETLIPATTAVIAGPAATTLPGLAANVYPLGNVADFACQHELCIAAWSGTDWQPGQPLPTPLDVSGWGWATVTGNLPAALWGPRGTQTQPPLSSAVVQAVVGVTGTCQAKPPVGLTVQAGTLAVTGLTARGLTLSPGPSGGPGPAPAEDARAQVASTINDATVMAMRAAVTAAANSSGLGAGLTAGALPLLAGEVYAVLTDPPMVGPPGTTGPPPSPPATSPAAASGTGPASTEAGTLPQAAAAPRLRALFRQDRPPTGSRAGGSAPARQAKTSATVLDRWATGRDVRLAALSEPEPGPGGAGSAPGQASARLLWPGMTAVWELPAGSVPVLRRDAGPALWIVAVDAVQRLVQAEIAQPGQTAWEVAPTATRVAVTALWDDEDVRAAGWHGSTVLRQVASQTLLGDGVVVRPQGPCGLPRRRSSRGRRFFRELGVTTGQGLVERTWVQRADARVRPGWVETYLPAWCQAVVVSLVPDGGPGSRPDAASPRVGLRLQQAGRPDQAVAPLSTDFHGISGRGTWRFVIAERGDRVGQLVTRVAAPDGWRLDGIAGLASTAMPWAGWPREAAMSAPPRAAVPEPSRVWWE